MYVVYCLLITRLDRGSNIRVNIKLNHTALPYSPTWRKHFPETRREQYLEKPLPSSEESERVILGAILLDNAVIAQAVEHLKPRIFTRRSIAVSSPR